MGTFKRLIIFATLLGLAGPAYSGNFSTLTQYFDVHYAPVASNGPQDFMLYNGPFRLYDVTVDWSGGAYAYFDFDVDQSVPRDYYTQPFGGEAGFWMYSEDPDIYVYAYESQQFSGETQCSQYECYVAGFGSGVSHLAPEMFVGSGVARIDSSSGIMPTWYGEGAWDGSGAIGTITYTLGPVPEPGTWAMMFGGFGLIGGIMRRRQRQRAKFI